MINLLLNTVLRTVVSSKLTEAICLYLLHRKTGNIFYEALVWSQTRCSHGNKYRCSQAHELFLFVGLHTRFYIFSTMNDVFKP